MLRNLIVFLAAIALCPLVQGGGAQDDLKKMEGDWSPVMAELGGAKLPPEPLKTIKLTLKDGKYTVVIGDKIDKGTYKIDAAKKPKELDITGTEGSNKGKKFLAIYELNGDTLKVCYDLSGKERPTEFATKADTQLFLAEYKRDKK
jgi:uncharacterized protein (TIGR03067 family)